ncbi:hypothetical protein GDO86_017858 [Hymenochirus boettgeri]|uniref:Uncharacterized protein n=1 Tax=Hymenochirus boettgeri TaxID=247094 RepID=A0A8T2ILD8_9PIPI|nr:hypothetical protein GDO86_017858 [Hymenochirus boettgeri]
MITKRPAQFQPNIIFLSVNSLLLFRIGRPLDPAGVKVANDSLVLFRVGRPLNPAGVNDSATLLCYTLSSSSQYENTNAHRDLEVNLLYVSKKILCTKIYIYNKHISTYLQILSLLGRAGI